MDAVILIICVFFDRFREFGLKMPIHAPKKLVFGGYDPLNGEPYQLYPNITSLRESASFDHHARTSADGLTRRRVPKKGHKSINQA